jgi:methyl-accepting chemotaxis protein
MSDRRASALWLAPGIAALQRLGMGAKLALLATLCALVAGVPLARLLLRDGLDPYGVACLATAALLAYLMLAFHAQVAGALGLLLGALQAMGQGDLSRNVRIDGHDDFARLATALDTMNANLSALVADIRSESTLVSQAGASLAAGTEELSQRTERQAASLEQTSAGVLQLGSSVSQNAAYALSVEQLASQVHTVAESGGSRMRDAIDGMRAIKDSSSRVHDIIGVIDGIAFQTNILALNAAVEAARAGEHGRGFAVVAAEVRALALRSGSAAQEIKSLIATSSSQVESGVAQINQVGSVLSEVVDGIGRVAGNVRLITQAAAQQSDGLGQMTEAIGGLDDITQQNARMVEQTSNASADIGQRAERLARSVGGFRLRQGTADEAHALVIKAVALFKRSGTAALPMYTDPAQGFADRDMYVFAWDRGLVYRAFAGKPANVGRHANEILGTDTAQLGRDVWAAAEAGGGWVDYDFLHPATGALLPKTSFVMPVSKDLVVGCGVYKTVARR